MTIDPDYYVNVWECMMDTIHLPRLRRTVVCTVDEWLPIHSYDNEGMQ